MARGKQTCKILKEIRRQIAEANGIEFATSECRYKGDCLGTCPKCEAEVLYLEQQLRSRQRMGKAIILAGISTGALALLNPNGVSAQAPDPNLSLPMGDIAVHAVTDTFMVKGVVCEKIDSNGITQREPLIGATIINLRNNKGCASGIEGDFEIEVAPGDTLEVSFPGYHILKVPIKRWSDNLDIVLEADESVLTGDVLVLGGAISVKREINHYLDLNVIDEEGNRIDKDDLYIERIWIDDDNEEDSRFLSPEYFDEKHPCRIFWDYDYGLTDEEGKPLKEATLRIEADGYDDPVIIKVKYPKRNTKKTIKFKHKEK